MKKEKKFKLKPLVCLCALSGMVGVGEGALAQTVASTTVGISNGINGVPGWNAGGNTLSFISFDENNNLIDIPSGTIRGLKDANLDDDSAAVNVGVLKSFSAGFGLDLLAGENITLVPGTSSEGKSQYTIHAKGYSAVAGSDAVTVNTTTNNQSSTFNFDLSESTKTKIEDGVQAKNRVDTQGLGFIADTGQSDAVLLGESLSIKGADNNLKTQVSGKELQIELNKNLDLGPTGSIALANTRLDATGLTLGSTQIKEGSIQLGDALTLNSTGLIIKEGPSLTQEGLHLNGKKITALKEGTEDSDAVNFSQLKQLGQQINELNAGWRLGIADEEADQAIRSNQRVDFAAGPNLMVQREANQIRYDLQPVLVVGQDQAERPIRLDAHSGTITQLHNIDWDGQFFVSGRAATEDQLKHAMDALQAHVDTWQPQPSEPQEPSIEVIERIQIEPLHFFGDQHIQVQRLEKPAGDEIHFSLKSALELQEITAQQITAEQIRVKQLEVQQIIIPDGPSLSEEGIDMNHKRIRNLTPGIAGTDAVNLNQLNSVKQQLHHEINKNKRMANAGSASAMAMAILPQANLAGESVFSLGSGVWRGQSGYALGLSHASENGKWLVRGAVNTSAQGGGGLAMGAGYRW